MADSAIKNAKVGSLLTRVHPKHAEYSLSWVFFLESYLGGPSYLSKHLFQYFKEGDEEFAARKDRAYRENHTKRVVDLVNSYLFKQEAGRSSDNALVKKFWENFDGRGGKVGRFMKKASVFASIMGRVYIVCDKRGLPEERQTGTQLDNLQSEAQPYCYLVYPQDLLDVGLDDQGRMRWAVIREYKRDDDDPFHSTGDVQPNYRFWTRDEWTLYDESGQEIGGGHHGLGMVPIVTLDSEEQDDYTGQSLVGDVAYLDRAIMNNWSRLDVVVNDQTFSQLIFPVEGLPADIMEDKELREKFLTLATNRVILYSAQAQAAPSFISPDASQATFILEMIQTQVKQLYASMGLQGETGVEVKTQSGVSKGYDFEKLNKLLANKADNLEQAEDKILDIFRGWMGGINAEAKVEYPDEFDVKSLSDEITMAQELTLMGISETFTKELHKSIAAKVLNKTDQPTMQKINQEIDDRDIAAEEAAKKPVFDFDQQGKPPAPGDQKIKPGDQKIDQKKRRP
jgi:hypothetical protein